MNSGTYNQNVCLPTSIYLFPDVARGLKWGWLFRTL